MSEMTISVPPNLQRWVETRLADGEYADLSDYLRDLIRRDRAVVGEREELRALIEEGIASGIDPRDPRAIVDALLAEDPDFRV